MKNTDLKFRGNRFTGQITAVFFTVILVFAFLTAGCQKKEEQPQQQQTPQTQTADTTKAKAADTTKASDTAASKQTAEANVPDLKGTWSGQFDKRATTLKIKEMNGNDFKGTITINYREVINQQVSGKIDPATKKVTMKDLLHSRFQGKYSGKVSDDMKKLSGTFTMDLDGSKFNFNLTKK
ncbi:MAG: hypothetical protein ACM34K_03815 [Bacillota bacterium]